MTIDYYASATDQIAMLQRGEISSAALLEAHLQRNAALHKKLNAVVATDEAAAFHFPRKRGLAAPGWPESPPPGKRTRVVFDGPFFGGSPFGGGGPESPAVGPAM